MAVHTDRRTPLSRERVLRAALAMADDGGIESLSMRKLGQALGVEAMSLYNHVANKDDLLDGVVDLIWSEIGLPPEDQDWETAIRSFAITAHDALVRHPWACNLVMKGRLRPARMEYLESLLRTFRRAGFSAEATYHAYHAIDSHILGFTLWQQGHSMPGGMPRVLRKEDIAVFVARLVPGLNIDDYPYLLEHGMQHLSEGSHKDIGEYEFKLGLILDGLRKLRGAA